MKYKNPNKETWCTCTKKIGWTKLPDSKWWVCPICLKPSRQTLNQCDTCDREFMGIPHVKVAYTCPECE